MNIRQAQLLARYYDRLANEMDTMGRHVAARTTRERGARCKRVIAAWRGSEAHKKSIQAKEVPTWVDSRFYGLMTK